MIHSDPSEACVVRKEGAMRHYNQTYQGGTTRGNKVFSTGRFIQGILDVGVT